MFVSPASTAIQCTGFIEAVTFTAAVSTSCELGWRCSHACQRQSVVLSAATTCAVIVRHHIRLFLLFMEAFPSWLSRTSSEAMLRTETPWLREALFNGSDAFGIQAGNFSHARLVLGTSKRMHGCISRPGHRAGGPQQNPVCRLSLTTRRMSLPAYLSHPAGSTHCYLVRRFNGCGHQEQDDGCCRSSSYRTGWIIGSGSAERDRWISRASRLTQPISGWSGSIVLWTRRLHAGTFQPLIGVSVAGEIDFESLGRERQLRRTETSTAGTALISRSSQHALGCTGREQDRHRRHVLGPSDRARLVAPH